MASSKEESNGSGEKGLMKQFDNYIIVDIGANLTNKKFSRDLDSVIKRAKESGRPMIKLLAVCIIAQFKV